MTQKSNSNFELAWLMIKRNDKDFVWHFSIGRTE